MNNMTTSIVEKVGNATSVSNNRACSNGGSRENECGDVTLSTEGGDCLKKPLCNGGK